MGRNSDDDKGDAVERTHRRQWFKRMSALLAAPSLLDLLKETSFGSSRGGRRAFKRSDVVFAFVFTPPEYAEYHTTILFGWCGAPQKESEIPEYLAKQKAALAVGVRMGSGISGFADNKWYQQRDPNWQEALWRNPEGQLLTFPWVRPPDPFPPDKGEVCSNHPLFLENKLGETDLAMAVKPYALHIDDPLGTATELRMGAENLGYRTESSARDRGCFCKYCMAGFRAYLKERVSPAALRRAGVTDLDTFDYGKFLRGRTDLPLWYEFENFQLRTSVEHVKKIFNRAREKRGGWIPVGANAPVVGPHIVFAPYLDYIAAEVGTDAHEKRFGPKPMLNYKMGDALGVAVAATGIYQDWAMLTYHDIPDLVRGWIAESYACGGNFIVPHKEWGFVQPPGEPPRSTAYPDNPKNFAPLYKFVRDHADLLDDYEAITQVALLYDYKASRLQGGGTPMPQTPGTKPVELHEICLELANANIPFGMVVAGGEPFDHQLTPSDLEEYELVIVNEPVAVVGKQKTLLDSWAKNGKVFRWQQGLPALRSRLETLIKVEPGDVWALPRAIPGRADTPLVCHVLNRAYDARAERLVLRENVRMGIHKKIFGGRGHQKCEFLVEQKSPVELSVRETGEFVEVTIPRLELWGILKFT